MAATTRQLITDKSKFADAKVLEIYDVPDTDIQLEKLDQIVLRPVIGVNEDSDTFELKLNAGPHWLLLNEAQISCEMSIVRADGTALRVTKKMKPPNNPGNPPATLNPETPESLAEKEKFQAAKTKYEDELRLYNEHVRALDVVAPINGIGNTFIQEFTIQTPTQTFITSSHTQPFIAHMDHTLNHLPSEFDGRLAAAGWTKDTAPYSNSSQDPGFKLRRGKFETIKEDETVWVPMIANLSESIYSIPRAFPNYMDLRFILKRVSNEFAVMNLNPDNNTKYKLQIRNLAIHLTRGILTPSLELSTAEFLKTNPAMYPIRRMVCGTYTIPKNSNSVQQLIHTSVVPKRTFFTLVKEEDYRGSQKTNPFNYDMKELRSYEFDCAGRKFPNIRSEDMDIPKGKCKQAYLDTLKATYQYHSKQVAVSLDEFRDGGRTIIGSLFTNDLEPQKNFSVIERGPTVLRLDFLKPLPYNMTLIVLSEFENLIKVNAEREIIEEFKPM